MRARRYLLHLAASALALLALGANLAAAATPGEVEEYGVHACLYADGLAPAPGEGVLLRTCVGSATTFGSTLANLLPGGQVIDHPVPTSGSGPIVAGPGGEIWSVATGEEGPAAGDAEVSLDRIAADGTVSTFPLGSATESPGRGLEAYAMVADGQGGVWVATGEQGLAWNGLLFNSTGGELAHVAADGTAAHFRLPEEIEPRSLVIGPDENLWFTGIKGRYLTMHSENRGDLYVGRMTPAGEFRVYRASPGGTEAAGITAGPDGRLWFVEVGTLDRLLGTIATDGQSGEIHFVHQAVPRGALILGPDGNFWLAANTGVLRVTPWNQETLYPLVEPQAVATGREGAIWASGARGTLRVVPGGPGIDVWKVTADPRPRTAAVLLACGGARASGCTGTLAMALKVPREKLPKGAKRKLVNVARVPYSVPAETTRTRTIALPARSFALARRYRPLRYGRRVAPIVIVRATVAGGPTATRKVPVPTLVPTR